MRFFYDSELLCEIRTLEKFSHLSDLCLNGGDFNKDPLRLLFENIGHQLYRLELNHVDNIGKLHILQQISLAFLIPIIANFLMNGKIRNLII